MRQSTVKEFRPSKKIFINLDDPAQIDLMSKLLNCSFHTMVKAVRNTDGTLTQVKHYLQYETCRKQNSESVFTISS